MPHSLNRTAGAQPPMYITASGNSGPFPGSHATRTHTQACTPAHACRWPESIVDTCSRRPSGVHMTSGTLPQHMCGIFSHQRQQYLGQQVYRTALSAPHTTTQSHKRNDCQGAVVQLCCVHVCAHWLCIHWLGGGTGQEPRVSSRHKVVKMLIATPYTQPVRQSTRAWGR